MNEYVRDEKGLITSGSAGLMAFRDVGFFEIDFETAKPLEAEIGVLAEVENIKKYGSDYEALTDTVTDAYFRYKPSDEKAQEGYLRRGRAAGQRTFSIAMCSIPASRNTRPRAR